MRLTPSSEVVILLHGFGARPLMMRAIERKLRQNRFDVINWGYASTRQSIAFHSKRLRDALENYTPLNDYQRVHLVGYSMGAIIARHTVASEPEFPPGRIVLLAAPNQGTHVARVAARVIGRFCPALNDLSDAHYSTVNSIRTAEGREIGVIAAKNDWVVPLSHTHLAEQRDHIVVPGDHLRLPLMRETSRQVITFLQSGEFSRNRR
jgi:pimeloyl-ACP methyl ester carboxylesterase